MPRPTHLSLTVLDPSTSLTTDDLIALLDRVPLPAGGAPLLVLRPGILGVRAPADGAADLARLLAWSAAHPAWLIVGGTLEWVAEQQPRRVVPILRAGGIVQAVAAVGSRPDIERDVPALTDLAEHLAVIAVDDVQYAVDLDPTGKAIGAYVPRHGGGGADVHLTLRSSASAAGIPRGHVARDGGVALVVRGHTEVSGARIAREVDMQSPDLDPNPRKTRMTKLATTIVLRTAPGVFEILEPIALASAPLEAAAPPQPLALSGMGVAQLSGKPAELPRLEDMSDQLSEQFDVAGKFSPTQAELDAMPKRLGQSPTQLNAAIAGYVQEAWSRLPPEHVAGARFDFIYRDKALGEIVSLYDGERAIAIRIPGNARRLYLDMTMKITDPLICVMHGRSDPFKSSFWFRGPSDRNAPHAGMIMMKHGARHELGHAIDGATGFSRWCLEKPQFGGWRRCDNETEWVVELMRDAAAQTATNLGYTPDQRQQLLAGFASRATTTSQLGVEADDDSVFSILIAAAKLKEGASPWKRKGPGWKNFDRLPEPTRTIALLALAALDKAITRPYLRATDRGVSLNGRIYQCDYQGTHWSYAEAAARTRISNYQFCNPKEWFAEAYSYYFDTPDDPGQYLRAVGDIEHADWFRDQLGPGGALLATNGLRRLA